MYDLDYVCKHNMSCAKFVPNANFAKLAAKSGLGKNLPSLDLAAMFFGRSTTTTNSTSTAKNATGH